MLPPTTHPALYRNDSVLMRGFLHPQKSLSSQFLRGSKNVVLSNGAHGGLLLYRRYERLLRRRDLPLPFRCQNVLVIDNISAGSTILLLQATSWRLNAD